MNPTIKKVLVIALILVIAVPAAIAADLLMDDPPHITTKTVYEGETPIKDAVDAKVSAVREPIEGDTFEPVDAVKETSLAVKAVMEKETYPYNISAAPVKEPAKGETKEPVTSIRIINSRYDEKRQVMGYWIEAYRDGQEVAVNNPVWIFPAPKDVIVSSSLDAVKNEVTITLKEDPKAAVEAILSEYVNRRPIGKAVTGTKE